jgi:hypothetical protein
MTWENSTSTVLAKAVMRKDGEWMKLVQDCVEWRDFMLTTSILRLLLPECYLVVRYLKEEL